jgi:hypothetical protein
MQMSEIGTWFNVRFDDWGVTRNVSPPGGKSWVDAFAWADVVRVCFRSGQFLEPDEYYVFTATRAESFVIPMGATGSSEFADEIYRRGLFPADKAIEAMMTEGTFVCWPPADDDSVT